MIVGTAGHIDHGKTALVKALTGVDTDRLKEEKARGITVDLGFAYLPLGAQVVGFVDVPGHERFIHNMLAGASGIDFALLLVAADDGVMPQTREHLDILELLGIRQGMVVISKADLADEARLAALRTEIAALVSGGFLAGAPILPVSARNGAGVPELRQALEHAAQGVQRRGADGAFRLAVDRSFTLAGAGTVVTGTVLSGRVEVGASVMVSPAGLPARIRSIHAQNQPSPAGVAGQRCALNLVGEGISKEAITRGAMVLEPWMHAPTERIDAQFSALSSEAKPLGTWFPARLHHASTEVGVRLVPLEASLAPGVAGMVQLVLDKPIAAAVGDRFILRDVSAQRTIGGGVFLDLRAPARHRRSPERMAQLHALARPDPAQAFAALLATPPYWLDADAFARDHALQPAAVAIFGGSDGMVLDSGGTRHVMAQGPWQDFAAALEAALAAYHEAHADQQGMGRERLRLAVQPRLPAPLFKVALEYLAKAGRVVADGSFMRLPGHEVRLAAEDQALYEQMVPLLGGEVRFRPPRVRDIAHALEKAEPEIRRVLKACARLGRLDQIAHDHFFLRATTVEMVGLVQDVARCAPDGFVTAALFRDRMDNGRKVAIQILDFLDQHGVTLRRGDLRRINPHRADLFGEPVRDEPVRHGGESSPVGRPDFKSGWGSETVPGGFDSHSPPPPHSPEVVPSPKPPPEAE